MSIGRVGIASIIVIATLAPGCADHRAPDREPAGSSSGDPFDWEDPFPDGDLVTLQQLASDQGLNVVFTPWVPAGLEPNIIQQAPPEYPPEFRQLAMSFSTAEIKRFVIFQYPIDEGAARAELEAIANQEPGCETFKPDAGVGEEGVRCTYGSGEWITLKDGTTALAFMAETVIGLYFTRPISPRELGSAQLPHTMDEPAVEIEIQTPRGTADLSDLQDIAESLVPVQSAND
jgi:hypothetical protein